MAKETEIRGSPWALWLGGTLLFTYTRSSRRPNFQFNLTKKICANAYGMRDSISLMLCAGCLGLSPVISMKNSLFKCASQPEIAKTSLKPYFWGSRSFKVIDVGTPGKLVSSACYDTQQVCVYLQPLSC